MFDWRKSGDLALMGRPSAAGLCLGGLFLAASLTPSLIPRAGLVQGALGGICFATGYLIGHALSSLKAWIFESAEPGPAAVRRRLGLALGIGAVAVIWALWNVTGWQNDIHAAMGMAPVESARPFTIIAVAALIALVLILLGRLFRRLWRVLAAQLERFAPRRLAVTLSIALAAALFWILGNDVMLNRVLTGLDHSYAAVDSLIPPEAAPPEDPLKSGSEASLIRWEDLGAAGRDWVLAAPDAAAITAVSGRPALEPLRIYVGLASAVDAEARAELALAEALRVGAFERATLVIATPTGTGWMDPAGMAPLDHVTEGDLATVAVQYSYLPSWLSLFVMPEHGAETARAVFRRFHAHWTRLPEGERPRLVLFGLSLGAMNGQAAVTMNELLSDPPQAALWTGPPFSSREWRQVIAERSPGSPPWAPEVADGAVTRSMTQELAAERIGEVWPGMRILYLTYPSDPIAFFQTSILWQRPDWMEAPRGPDVSASLRWFPVVTFLQLGFDMMTATTAPMGHGHVYAPEDYLRGWLSVLGRGAWDSAGLERLRNALKNG